MIIASFGVVHEVLLSYWATLDLMGAIPINYVFRTLLGLTIKEIFLYLIWATAECRSILLYRQHAVSVKLSAREDDKNKNCLGIIAHTTTSIPAVSTASTFDSPDFSSTSSVLQHLFVGTHQITSTEILAVTRNSPVPGRGR